MSKVSLIIQARMGSRRLPGKTLLPLAGKPLIYRIIERVKRCREIDNLILAIPNTNIDKKIKKINFNSEVKIFKGSENDLVSRYFFAAKKYLETRSFSDPLNILRLHPKLIFVIFASTSVSGIAKIKLSICLHRLTLSIIL